MSQSHLSKFYKDSSSQGFTLIEVLVVLSITSLVTTLLIAGINTTWSNFNKLNSSQLLLKSSRLPLAWFAESIEGAVLLHPYKSYFQGSRDRIEFSSYAAPHSPYSNVVSVEWSIKSGDLRLTSQYPNKINRVIKSFGEEVSFEYLTNDGWKKEFASKSAQLPKAVRITSANNSIKVVASPKRPLFEEAPADLKLSGELVL